MNKLRLLLICGIAVLFLSSCHTYRHSMREPNAIVRFDVDDFEISEQVVGIAKFIENNNGRGGMHHIAFAVENIEGHLEEAKELGIRLIDQTPRGGAEGLSIAFLHPKSTFGVLTELCENKNK